MHYSFTKLLNSIVLGTLVLALPAIANAMENRRGWDLDGELGANYAGLLKNDYVVLQPGKSLSNQITKENTVYEIKNDFNLQGQTLVLPNRCALFFNGGVIRNGTLVGKNTVIKSENDSAILFKIKLDGSWFAETGYPEWFGAVGNGITDDRDAVQNAFDICKTVVLSKHYLIHNAPFNYSKYKPIPDDELKYYKDVLAQKNNTPDSQLTPLRLSSNKEVVISGTIKAYSPLGNLIELKGDNTIITGGGTISGCGIVNTVNIYSGTPSYKRTAWESALIYIKGSNNCIENLTIKDPTRQGISIDDYLSNGNVICGNVIGGGLKAHTKATKDCNFTGLFGVYARGTNTVVRDNVFKPLDDRMVYSALYCNYSTDNVPPLDRRTDIHTVFDNNVVEGALEHAIYTYAKNLRITGNTVRSNHTAFQLFNGSQFVDNNTIFCNNSSLGIYVSGENQTVTNNKIYDVGRYGIRCAGYYNGSCDNDYVANNYIRKLMVPFDEADPKTSPAISFESKAFENNKLHLQRITCENNTVECIGESQSARTSPIVGIIAVYGDANTTIERINIINNTVLNSNVADNIGITLLNEDRSTVAIIEGNRCINNCPIISTTPGEPILKIQGVKRAIVRSNHFEQQGNTGTAFGLEDVDNTELSDNTIKANLYSKSMFFLTKGNESINIDSSNIINESATEQTVTIPANSSSSTMLRFALPDNRWELEITPMNRAAKKAEKTNPLKILTSDVNGVQLYHEKAIDRITKYKVRVVYH